MNAAGWIPWAIAGGAAGAAHAVWLWRATRRWRTASVIPVRLLLPAAVLAAAAWSQALIPAAAAWAVAFVAVAAVRLAWRG